ncbi:undecaprenyl diphosphate synthase [Bartonella australis AUST/NH1]|uniref:Isoprenyl transferase n=1 Tax=Bartonella australis (strain Aust/NH1) TaxID=1094489 RepID=M1N3D4_BARAA|nr:isoprenyl transferase [Bartonella australis]AGF74424.1 undecaprenyl diphosphate synthase [Bartonella australis AUST/NH1]
MSYPRHIAIIMDGNGRWARARGLPRVAGHKAGIDAFRRIVRYTDKVGLEWLTVFAFSSENWTRPRTEVSYLMGLLKKFIKYDLAELHDRNVRIHVIGDRSSIPEDVLEGLVSAEHMTRNNDGLNLVVAFSYGGRNEISRAVRCLAQLVFDGLLFPEQITDGLVADYLDTKQMPDPDLIIRTSGERRFSNFLLWQAAYSELYFSSCFWPDFDEKAFEAAVADYRSRERRFGVLNHHNNCK